MVSDHVSQSPPPQPPPPQSPPPEPPAECPPQPPTGPPPHVEVVHFQPFDEDENPALVLEGQWEFDLNLAMEIPQRGSCCPLFPGRIGCARRSSMYEYTTTMR